MNFKCSRLKVFLKFYDCDFFIEFCLVENIASNLAMNSRTEDSLVGSV